MRLVVKNFGPVASGRLDIKPVTVIVGKNNLGKSFLAQLLFAVVSAMKTQPRMRYAILPRRYGIMDIPTEYIFEEMLLPSDEMKAALRLFKKSEMGLQQMLKTAVHLIIKQYELLMQGIVHDSFEAAFGQRPIFLVRHGARHSYIRLELSSVVSLCIRIAKNGRVSVSFKAPIDSIVEAIKKTLYDPSATNSMQQTRLPKKKLYRIVETVREELFDNYKLRDTFYLPAGRGGLIDSWETISTAWVNLAPVAIPRGLRMPALPGVSAIFYDLLQSLSGKRKGYFESLSQRFHTIIHGEIQVLMDKEMRGKKNLEYEYKIGDRTYKMNIIHAGSMVKEIGPLYLIVREVVDKKDFLIVEEPESHLHPTAQRDLVLIMVDLAKEGTHVLFTTHSDILVRTVGHTIRKQALESEERISLKDLAIYLLKEEANGSISKLIKVSKKGAIDQLPTFDEVMQELYDEEMRLEGLPYA